MSDDARYQISPTGRREVELAGEHGGFIDFEAGENALMIGVRWNRLDGSYGCERSSRSQVLEIRRIIDRWLETERIE